MDNANKGIISKIREKIFNTNKKSMMLTVGAVGLWVNLLASSTPSHAFVLPPNLKNFNKQEETIDFRYRSLINENTKKESLKEYEQIFSSDKNLKLVFSEQELSEILNKSISDVYMYDKVSIQGTNGGYNAEKRAIAIDAREIQDGYFFDILSHEVTHAIFTRSQQETGFAIGTIGDGLNEGATEYIATKIVGKTEHKMLNQYSKNVRIFSMLCATYGENVMFKALKEGPSTLAKILQKDGVSYNELTGIMDEFLKVENKLQDLENPKQSALYKEYESLYSRADKLVFELAKKKYQQADLKGKLEITDRIKQIQYEQNSKNRTIANATLTIFNDGRTDSKVGVNNLGPLVDLVTDGYGLYLNSKKMVLGSNVQKDDIRVLHTGMQIMYLSNNNISINEMDNIKLQAVKDKNGENTAYVIRNDKEILNILSVRKHEDRTEIQGYSGENMEGFLSSQNFENRKEVSELALKYKADKSSVFMYKGDFSKTSGINEESIVRNNKHVVMFLNNEKGDTVVLTYDGETGRYENMIVEDVCKVGEVLQDRNQSKPLFENVKNVLNPAKKPLKLNAGQNVNDVKQVDTMASEGKQEKNDFVENIRKAMQEREIEEQENKSSEEPNFFIENMRHEMELQKKQREEGQER